MDRVQKILSQAGIASRRASEQLMLDGRVTVNGTTVRSLGTKADAAHDDIRVDGRRIRIVARHRYLLLNKPRGYLTTRSDPQRRPTVLDLLHGIREYVYPVGQAPGRKTPEQITLFDSVGFATEDFSALRYVRDQLQATGLYEELDLLADPDEPRDLFGMLLRAAMQPAT